jgi:colicin import membrane protein
MSSNQKVTPDSAFKRALNKSLVLHGALIVLVIARVSFPSSQSHAPKASMAMSIENNPMPIQATVIDAKALDAEVARQAKAKADELAKVAEEKQRVINEQKKLEQARAAEEKRLADIQAKKKAAEVALKAQQKQIAEAKQKAAEAKTKQLAAEKAAKAIQDKAKMQADAAAKAKAQKEAELAKAIAADRMVMDADNSAAMSGESLREIDRYKLMVQQQIMRFWFVQGAPTTGASTQLFVRVAPNGTVLDVKISRSSGNDALDRSAMAAVYKASPLPVPQDPALFSAFRELRLTLRPDAVVSEG